MTDRERELSEEVERLRHYQRSHDGRLAALQRKLRAVQEAGQSASEQVAETLKQSVDEYPEVAGPMGKALGAVAEAVDRQNVADAQEYHAYVGSEAARLEAAIPGYQSYMQQNAPAFAAWVDDQPKAVRDAFARNVQDVTNAGEAYALIMGFHEWVSGQSTLAEQNENAPRGAPQQQLSTRRQRQLASTAAPVAPRVPVSPESAGGDPEAVWKDLVRQERASRRRA
jgi:hypothetical protein